MKLIPIVLETEVLEKGQKLCRKFKDDISRLRAALSYLEKHNA